MTLPSKLPTWATGAASILEPSDGKKAQGWVPGEQPPASFFNYWQNLVGQWIQALRDGAALQAAADLEVQALLAATASGNVTNATTSSGGIGPSGFSETGVALDANTGFMVWAGYAASLIKLGRYPVSWGGFVGTTGPEPTINTHPTFCAPADAGVVFIGTTEPKIYYVTWPFGPANPDVPLIDAGSSVSGSTVAYHNMAVSGGARVFVSNTSPKIGYWTIGAGSIVEVTPAGMPIGAIKRVVTWDPDHARFVCVCGDGSTWTSPTGAAWSSTTAHGYSHATGLLSSVYYAPMRAIVVCGKSPTTAKYSLKYSQDGGATWIAAGLGEATTANAEVFASANAVYVRGFPRAGSSTTDRLMYSGNLTDPASWKFFDLKGIAGAAVSGSDLVTVLGQYAVLTVTTPGARSTILVFPSALNGSVLVSAKISVI